MIWLQVLMVPLKQSEWSREVFKRNVRHSTIYSSPKAPIPAINTSSEPFASTQYSYISFLRLWCRNNSLKLPGCWVILQFVSTTCPGFLRKHIIDVHSGSDKSSVCERGFILTHYGTLDPKLHVFTNSSVFSIAKLFVEKIKESKTLEIAVEESVPIKTLSPELTPSELWRFLQQVQAVNTAVICLIDILEFNAPFNSCP